jgi:hypothetical protein
MGYSRDFEGVLISGRHVLVDATSIDDDTGQPGTKDPATGFHVVLVKAAGGATCDVSAPVAKGVNASWTAKFPDAASHYAPGDEVHVIGLGHPRSGRSRTGSEHGRFRTMTTSGLRQST